MSQRARTRSLDETLPEGGIKWVDNEDATLLAGDHIVYVKSATAAVSIILPPMAEATGKFYWIQAPDGVTNKVTVKDYESETEITTYGAMDANDDAALFYCTGIDWVVPFEQVA